MAAGLTYFRITALSFPFLALYNAGAAIFRSMGNSKISMKVSLVMNVINVGKCPVHLRPGDGGGWWPFPPWFPGRLQLC